MSVPVAQSLQVDRVRGNRDFSSAGENVRFVEQVANLLISARPEGDGTQVS
jgi:hypothetical protein